MKLLIACDMEGISGVVSWDQVDPSKPEYQRFRHIITADVNAAVAGACCCRRKRDCRCRWSLEQQQRLAG